MLNTAFSLGKKRFHINFWIGCQRCENGMSLAHNHNILRLPSFHEQTEGIGGHSALQTIVAVIHTWWNPSDKTSRLLHVDFSCTQLSLKHFMLGKMNTKKFFSGHIRSFSPSSFLHSYQRNIGHIWISLIKVLIIFIPYDYQHFVIHRATLSSGKPSKAKAELINMFNTKIFKGFSLPAPGLLQFDTWKTEQPALKLQW